MSSGKHAAPRRYIPKHLAPSEPRHTLPIVLLLVVSMVALVLPNVSASAVTTSTTFTSVADAYVKRTSSTTNFGSQTDLEAEKTNIRSYLRFSPTGLAGTITNATLRLWAIEGHPSSVIVSSVADTGWLENQITWNNAPPVGAPVGTSSTIKAGTWVTVNVTSLVKGNGLVSLALTTTQTGRKHFASRETSHAPQLVVTTSVPATTTTTTASPTTTTTTPGSVDTQPSFPMRGAFYYPWFPEAWNQQGLDPFSQYTPSDGFYDSSNPAIIADHVAAMQYGGMDMAISSWWGQGTPTDQRVPALLAGASGTAFRWTLYYEPEGTGDPAVSQITADLTYMRDHYGSNPSYLRVNGHFVVFVYADGADACGMADRWKQANTVGAYIVLKVFGGYTSCASQPDGWHQYAPAVATDAQGPYSFSISPGFFKANESTPRLARDTTRWTQNIQAMVASQAKFQLVTTFNEWGEGTAVESATQWATGGHGTYLDALHAVLGSTGGGGAGGGGTTTTTTQPPTTTTTGPPTTTTSTSTSTTSTTSTSTTSTTLPPTTTTTTPASNGPCQSSAAPATYNHVIWIWMENHTSGQVFGTSAAPYQTQLFQQCGSATNYAVVGSPSLPNYIGATSGATFGINDDASPSTHVLTADNLFRQVRASGGTAKSYDETMPSNCDTSDSGTYAVKHNPAPYYQGGTDRAACLADDVPMGTTSAGNFLNDLNGTLPTFAFITPNLCNDTHDCSVATGDAWLKSWIPKILASGSYQSGDTAVVLMYDEYTPIPNVFISPSVIPGSRVSAATSQFSLLRTTEEMLGISTFLGSAATALSLRTGLHL